MSELKQGQEPEWYLSISKLLENAKGFDDMPLELQEAFRTYERQQLEESKKPRPNGGIIGGPEEWYDTIIQDQSRTITKLCIAIDPTHSHGPETDKICAYVEQLRQRLQQAEADLVNYKKADNDELFMAQAEIAHLHEKLKQAEDAVAKLDECLYQHSHELAGSAAFVAQYRLKCDQLQASQQRAAELEKDKDRLDWLSTQTMIPVVPTAESEKYYNKANAIGATGCVCNRQAIDSARSTQF